MVLLQVLLDVVCCGCGQRMAVTVKCEGESLSDGGDALVSLGCTACGKRNYVIFAPESGEVVDVMDRLQVLRLPEPSLN